MSRLVFSKKCMDKFEKYFIEDTKDNATEMLLKTIIADRLTDKTVNAIEKLYANGPTFGKRFDQDRMPIQRILASQYLDSVAANANVSVQAEILNALLRVKYPPIMLAYLTEIAGKNKKPAAQCFDENKARELCEWVADHADEGPEPLDYLRVIG